MNDYLSKPVELNQLAGMLARWLPGFAPGDPSPASEPAAPARSKALFDEEDLLRRFIGDRQLARGVLRGFLQDVPSILNHLHRQLEDADAPGAAMQAHALKGAASAVSAGSLHALAQAMEQAGRAGEWTELGALLPRAADEFTLLQTVLDRAGWLGQEQREDPL
jgi:HPt (histidine-containing phosphotransfer) domain-containing protein